MTNNIISCICSSADKEQTETFLEEILRRTNILVVIAETEESVMTSDIVIYVHSSNCINDEKVSRLLKTAYYVNKAFIPVIIGGNAVTNTYLKSRYNGPNLRTEFLILNSDANKNEFYSQLYAVSGKVLIGDAYGKDIIFEVDLDCQVYKDNELFAEIKQKSETPQYIRCLPTTQKLRFQSTQYKELSVEKKINFSKLENNSVVSVVIADYRRLYDARLTDGWYTGSMFLEKRDGEGACRFRDGSSYSGSWKDDMTNGKGTFTFPDKRTYTGIWVDNILVTLKSNTWQDCVQYDGDTKGKIEGLGHSEWRKNNWTDGMRHGNGKCTFVDGSVYTGGWEHNKLHGEGKMTFSNGDTYEGTWKNNQMFGNGVYTCKLEFSTYVGEMKYDKPNGLGVKTWRKKEKYEGFFRDGQMSGRGIMHYCHGAVYDGEWSHNQREGYGKLTSSNGDVYEGHWHNDIRHGEGKITWKRNGTYVGQWRYNHMHGNGVRIWRNGKRYEGDWVSSKRHGHGVLYNSKGEVEFDGMWEDDKRMNWWRRSIKKLSN